MTEPAKGHIELNPCSVEILDEFITQHQYILLTLDKFMAASCTPDQTASCLKSS
jgi:hypothetical protein